MEHKRANIAATVEDHLRRYLDGAGAGLTPAVFPALPPMAIMEEVRSLTLRGGKRIRAALVVCGYELFQEEGLSNPAVLDVAAAMELLQTYFLIHDDIMDEDDTRRGGPSVHASLQARTGSEKAGRDLGILAGDLASALAHELMGGLPQEPGSQLAMRVLTRMHLDVIAGQVLDLEGGAPQEVVLRKTASYTTVGPLCMGAALAGASEEALELVAAVGRPLGIAFQYRDDLIGLFSPDADTGKPTGSDLRNQKRTRILEDTQCAADETQRRVLDAVLGNDRATGDQVEAALQVVEQTGARAACEAAIADLTAASRQHLTTLSPLPQGREFLEWMGEKLAVRNT